MRTDATDDAFSNHESLRRSLAQILAPGRPEDSLTQSGSRPPH